MKNKIITSALLAAFISFSGNMFAQELFRADFETYETTPYFFRFGNTGKRGDYKPKSRWMYSHEVIDNPVSAEGNHSGKVLKYASMEARNYGLKFLFDTPISIDDLKVVEFMIYQPLNVIGKETDDWEDPAEKQDICIKLLSKFNTTNDLIQDEGILLNKSVYDFTTEGKWITYTFTFNKAAYSSQISKFTNGVLGIAILPTYTSNVVLYEDQQHVCYIDNIVVNPSPTGISGPNTEKTAIEYSDGKLTLCGAENGPANITVYDTNGCAVTAAEITVENGKASLALPLDNNKVYLVNVVTQNQCYRQKISKL